MTSLEQLRMFVAAAETGSFSAAGRQINKGQSAVSLGISSLETDLGVDLFDRTTRKPNLTLEGKRLIPLAKATLMQAEDFDLAASKLFAGEETCIRIVLDDAILVPALSKLLVEFGKRFPATQVEILSAVSPDIPKIVEQEKAEIGLMFSGGKVQKGVEQTYIGNLPFISISHPDYPLAKLDSIGANELLPHRQLLLKSPQGSVLDQFPALSSDIWSAASFNNIRELAIEGVGWAYLPEHLADKSISSGLLVKLNFRFEHKHWSPPVESITQKNICMGPALSWLSQQCKDILS